MTTTFRDGPAQGVTLLLRNAPDVLRVVVGPRGRWDALDDPSDEPSAIETVHVYRLASKPSSYFACCGPGAGRYVWAEYSHVPDADGETLRDRAAWAAFANAQPFLVL